MPTVKRAAGRPHHYWRLKGLAVDLVLLNTYPPTYLQELQDALLTTVMGSSEGSMLDKPGGVFIRRPAICCQPDDLAALRAMAGVARAVRRRLCVWPSLSMCRRRLPIIRRRSCRRCRRPTPSSR